MNCKIVDAKYHFLSNEDLFNRYDLVCLQLEMLENDDTKEYLYNQYETYADELYEEVLKRCSSGRINREILEFYD